MLLVSERISCLPACNTLILTPILRICAGDLTNHRLRQLLINSWTVSSRNVQAVYTTWERRQWWILESSQSRRTSIRCCHTTMTLREPIHVLYTEVFTYIPQVKHGRSRTYLCLYFMGCNLNSEIWIRLELWRYPDRMILARVVLAWYHRVTDGRTVGRSEGQNLSLIQRSA